MFHTLTRSIVAIITAVLVIGMVPLPANAGGARTTVAFIGRPNNPAEAGCFGEWFGSMRNYCSTPSYFTVPLTVDAWGYYWVTVSAYGASSANNVGCQAFGVFKTTTDWASYYGSGTRYLPSFGASADIALSPVYVPGDGALFAACTINPGGQINVVKIAW